MLLPGKYTTRYFFLFLRVGAVIKIPLDSDHTQCCSDFNFRVFRNPNTDFNGGSKAFLIPCTVNYRLETGRLEICIMYMTGESADERTQTDRQRKGQRYRAGMGWIIDVKNMFYVFYKSLKNMFLKYFFMFLKCFFVLFNVVFLLLLKHKRTKLQI